MDSIYYVISNNVKNMKTPLELVGEQMDTIYNSITKPMKKLIVKHEQDLEPSFKMSPDKGICWACRKFDCTCAEEYQAHDDEQLLDKIGKI